MKYEYNITFRPVSYDLDGTEDAYTPDTQTFLNDAITGGEEPMNDMGEQGWELVSVQPVLEAVRLVPIAVGFGGGSWNAITKGYFLFWKRPLIEWLE